MISLRQILIKSARYHWRSHLGVVLGAAVGSAALMGALAVGDSVRESLKERARARLGAAELALSSGDRLFTAELANRFSPFDLKDPDGRSRQLVWGTAPHSPPIAGALTLRGTVARQDGTARAHEIRIYGATSNFWGMSPVAIRFRNDAQLNERVRWSPTAAPSEIAAFGQWLETWQRPAPGKVRINPELAEQLHAQPGDTLIVRFAKPSTLSADAVLNPRQQDAVALRVEVEDIVDSNAFGEFSLQSAQGLPFNAFVNLEELWHASGLTNQFNLLLAQGGEWKASDDSWLARLTRWLDGASRRLPRPLARLAGRLVARGDDSAASSEIILQRLTSDLERRWTLDDAQIAVRLVDASGTEPPAGAREKSLGRPRLEGSSDDPQPPMVEVATPRIFLERRIVAAATAPDPTLPPADQAERSWMTQGMPILTYLVNAIRASDRLTPYSMVTAAGPPWTPADLGDDQIVLNDWLAQDLAVKPGDRIDLVYYDPEAGARLLERTNTFTVHSVVPMTGIYSDRSLMPEFPGLANAEKTSDWDAGFPLVHRIRDQDEQYWSRHRGTPKAFITLRAGRALWANRFGDATAVRYLVPPGQFATGFQKSVAANLRAGLRSQEVGLVFQPVLHQALKAATSGQDFGQLFLGFSVFLVIAALLLMGLLFQFGLEQRLPEIGTFLALGFRPPVVRRLWLAEGCLLAIIGGVAGVAGGIGYARLMIRGLTTIWSAAVGGATLRYHANPGSLGIGLGASVLVAALTLWLALRRQFNRPARELLNGEIASRRPGRRSRGFWLGSVTLTAASALLGWTILRGDTANAGAFFGVGSLLLIAGLSFAGAWLGRGATARAGPGTVAPGVGSPSATAPAAAETLPRFQLTDLAVRGTQRRPSRSLATAGLLACGTFLIGSIGAFRMDAERDAGRRASGTGGFALIGQSSLPISQDLNSARGWEFFGLEPGSLPGVRFVPFRVRDGDDASCLNLNRAQRPRILGVRPESLAELGAFRFAQLAPGIDVTNGWMGLSGRSSRNPASGPIAPADAGSPSSMPSEIPTIGDAASIQWALGKRLGETLELTDERGLPIRLRFIGGVANSILQGSLVIDEEAFKRLFPGEGGYRYFLIDAPAGKVEAIAATLARAMQDVGMELTPTARRLAQLNAVQNTYLTTFQILGGLGLLLGSAGLGVVVLRNVLERRGELALFTAVGFPRVLIARLVLGEHLALLLLGLGIGLVSAAVAVLPGLLAPAADFPFRSLGLTLGGVCLVGLLTTWLATRVSLHGPLLAALRGE